MLNTDLYKARLLARLGELDTRLHDIEHELDEPRAADFSERATESEGDEVLEHLGTAGLGEAEAIRHALKRIDSGTFGVCSKCEEDISEERLDVVPHAALCRNCAK
jgi:RNA polymerase-binding transcription factor DksA